MEKFDKTTDDVQKEIQEQAGKYLAQVAGFVGVKTMEMGLRYGFFEEIAKHPKGITSEDLARVKGTDPFYTGVWCRSAYSSEQLELGENQTYVLPPHVDKLFLDKDFPGFIGGLPNVIASREMFDIFAENIPTGKQSWWNEFSPEWIRSVGLTGLPFYTRLISQGLSKVPGLLENMPEDALVLDIACGAGNGLRKLAQEYPKWSLVGLDGDEFSLETVKENLGRDELLERVSLIKSTLEDINESNKYDLVIINISMHECRDIEKVTANIYRALKPGGYFVVSEFPFPEKVEETRNVPARIMCGIQFFEAIIGDQLLPAQKFIDLLNRHDFKNVDTFMLSPVHNVIYGRK